MGDAVVHYGKALAINPKLTDAQDFPGNVLSRQEKLDEAIDRYNEALKINQNNANAHYTLERQRRFNQAGYHYTLTRIFAPA